MLFCMTIGKREKKDKRKRGERERVENEMWLVGRVSRGREDLLKTTVQLNNNKKKLLKSTQTPTRRRIYYKILYYVKSRTFTYHTHTQRTVEKRFSRSMLHGMSPLHAPFHSRAFTFSLSIWFYFIIYIYIYIYVWSLLVLK